MLRPGNPLPLLLLLASLPAQDPPAPPGGFQIVQDLDRLTTWSDGYRTRTDVRYPAANAPATGWPGVVLLHGHTGSRKVAVVRERALELAHAGYVTIAYDTRGEGDTVALNPGWPDPTSARNVLDVAEAFHLAGLALAGTFDPARLGLWGQSGGASKSLQAASYSGQPLPETGFVATMPTIGCLMVDIQSLDYLEDNMPGSGTMVSTSTADSLWQRGGPSNPGILAIFNGDYAGLQASLAAEPVRNYNARLATQPIPILAENSWGDVNHFANATSDRLLQMLPGVPRRFVGSTGVHGTAGNEIESAWRVDLTRRWCDRFLKGIRNGADAEPAELAIPPLDATSYLDPSHPWAHRLAPSWPTTGPTTRLYLRAGGQLSATAPASQEGPFRVRHAVQPGYSILGFMTDGMDPRVVRTKIPDDEATFDLPAATVDRELLGRAVVEFDFACPVANAQLSASLFAVSPGGTRLWITTGSAALRGVTPGRQHLRIVLEEIPAVVPAGHRIRLAIHNTCVRRQPGNLHYFIVPEFTSADFDLATSPVALATLDLPLRPLEATLTPRWQEASAAAGISTTFQVRAGDAHAGDLYFVLIGGSGTTPAIHLPAPVWLVPDVWTEAGLLLLGSPALSGYSGTFDAQGRAAATLRLPAPVATALAGVRLDHVVLGLTPANEVFTSAPATLVVAP
ncbi:MAG: CocE/NonD family hydrolase C-terminal non-catalytic domain-containing protein [Planctomycetota bacterium]